MSVRVEEGEVERAREKDGGDARGCVSFACTNEQPYFTPFKMIATTRPLSLSLSKFYVLQFYQIVHLVLTSSIDGIKYTIACVMVCDQHRSDTKIIIFTLYSTYIHVVYDS